MDRFRNSGVVVKTGMARDNVNAQSVTLGFANLSGAQFAEFISVLTNSNGHLSHECTAFLRAEVSPDIFVRAPCIHDRTVNEVVVGRDHLSEWSPVDRLEHIECVAVRNVNECAPNEWSPEGPAP